MFIFSKQQIDFLLVLADNITSAQSWLLYISFLYVLELILTSKMIIFKAPAWYQAAQKKFWP